MKHLFIIVLIVLLVPNAIKAQLFVDNAIIPNTSTVKGRYYNGSGGRGYWSLDYLDSIGRLIMKESYYKKKLMARHKIVYDSHNNKLFDIQTYDVNNSERIDTIKYEYKYTGNRIIYQYRKLAVNDSSVTKLIKNEGDSIFVYQEMNYYYRPKTGKSDLYETIYTLTNRKNQLIRNEILDKQNNSKEIETYEYYDDGRLMRRLIQRIPEPKLKSVYTGGPGSDDEYYKYKFDSKDRIKKFYKIIDGRRYKIAVYSFKN
jgi:hypothetical protein